MDPRSLAVLEFPKILQRLAAHASFPLGVELIGRLRPGTSLPLVARRLAETTEARALLDERPGLSLGGARDLRSHVQRAQKAVTLAPSELLDVQGTLGSARDLRGTLGRFKERFPSLSRIADRLEDCPELSRDIERCIDDQARLRDSASPALARLRKDVQSAHDAVLDRMNRIATSSDTAAYLQEPIVTQRAGRYVVLVKADHKGRIPGIVHDQSASGVTLFVEPAGVVELANRWRTLEIEAEREEQRILAGLTSQVAWSAESLLKTLRALGELDLALAKARYSADIRGIEPQLEPPSESLGFRLADARHPLLRGDAVPVDVRLGDGFSILLITGPNTGGKTVTLKTVGLLALMAQAGLHIPAGEGSSLSVFRAIHADIGDEQSIEQNLSTFSSHMGSIIRILGSADERSLVLLDELGAGTDPQEGSALGQALLAHLLGHRIPTVATTHYPELKAFAHATPGIENASMEFDSETLTPTFKVRIGLPGRSNALAIARSLGLPEPILQEAERAVARPHAVLEDLLAGIQASQQATEEARRQATEARDAARADQEALLAQKAADERSYREALEEEAERVRLELAQVRDRLRKLERDLRMGVPALEAVQRARDEADGLADQLSALVPERRVAPVTPEPPGLAPGARVMVEGLDQEGELVSLAEDEAEVRMGNFRVRIDPRQMRLSPSSREPSASREVTVTSAPKPSLHGELDLRGLTAEEASERLDKYLDEAYLAGLPFVRIIHGKGTGVLRQEVRDILQSHPLVDSHRAGERNEGGDGVTIAALVSAA